MYHSEYEILKSQKKVIEKAFKRGRISEESYSLKIKELDEKIQDHEAEIQMKNMRVLGAKIQNGHYVIELRCPCGYEGTVTYGRMEFVLLGKDKKGFLYFKCPECKRHLQYDPITGKIKTQKGILGFLFGRFGL
jgi:hypothetical protein